MADDVIFVTIETPVAYYNADYDQCVKFFKRSEIGRKLDRFIDEVRVLVTSRKHMEVRVRISPHLSDEDKMEVLLRFGGNKPSSVATQTYGASRVCTI